MIFLEKILMADYIGKIVVVIKKNSLLINVIFYVHVAHVKLEIRYIFVRIGWEITPS